jgi:hypothetical protein
MAPQECIDVPRTEAIDSLRHLALERKPSQFAVRHDVESGCLLEGDGLINGVILNGLEFRVTETPSHPVVSGFAQPNWPEKTANNISMCRNHRSSTLPQKNDMAETRKLAAIPAADLAGYSKLAGADEERTLARLRALIGDFELVHGLGL